MLSSPAIIVDLSIYPCSSISFCLTHFVTLLLDKYTSSIIMSSGSIEPFIIMYHTSLSLITSLALKSALSQINVSAILHIYTVINSSASFWLVLTWYLLIHLFTLNLYMFLYFKWVPFRQHTLGSCFLIYPHHLCLLICIFDFKLVYLKCLKWLYIYGLISTTFIIVSVCYPCSFILIFVTVFLTFMVSTDYFTWFNFLFFSISIILLFGVLFLVFVFIF